MTDKRAEVQRLIDRGWKVIRLEPGSKKPLESGWPEHDAKAEDFQPGENVGVKFGPVSGGLVDVDLDYEQARKLIGRPAFGLDHLVEFGRSSQPAGERGHRLVVCADGPGLHRPLGIRGKAASDAMKQRGLKLTVLEVRGKHSSQTAFPPSVAKGDPLVWTVPGAEPPTMAWDELNHRVGLLALAALAAALYPDDDRETFCALLGGALTEAGATAVDDMVTEVALLCGDDDVALSVPAPCGGLHDLFAHVGLPEAEAAVRRWLRLEAPSEPAEEREPHDAGAQDAPGAFTAEQLQRMLAPLDPEDFADYYSWRDLMFAAHHATGGSEAGREAFVQWSARNPDFGPGKRNPQSDKPWADEIRGAWSRTGHDRVGSSITVGTLLRELKEHGHTDVAADFMHGDPVDDFDELDNVDATEQTIASMEAKQAEVKQKKVDDHALRVKRFTPMEVEDILKEPRPKWLIKDWMLEGSLNAIVGGEKTFKTFTGIDIACRIALGLDWHGIKMTQGRVLYVIGEGNPREFGERILAWCVMNGYEPSALRGKLRVIAVRVGIDNAEDMKAFFEAAYGGEAIVFIDTLARNMDGAENETRDMNLFIRGADDIRERKLCAVMIVHHTGKDPGKIYRGNSALVGAVDSMWLTSRLDDQGDDLVLELYRSRVSKQGQKRVFKAVEVTTQEMDGDVDEARSLAMTYVREGTAEDGKKRDAPKAQWEQVLVYLAEQPGCAVATQAEVHEAMGFKNSGSTSKVFTALRKKDYMTGYGPFVLTELGVVAAVGLGATLAPDLPEEG